MINYVYVSRKTIPLKKNKTNMLLLNAISLACSPPGIKKLMHFAQSPSDTNINITFTLGQLGD